MAIHITNFDDLKTRLQEAKDKLVIIDFMASWCGPCKVMAPKVEALAQEMSQDLVVLVVDVDENEEIAESYNIHSMPSYVFVKNNETIDEFAGANWEKLQNTVAKLK